MEGDWRPEFKPRSPGGWLSFLSLCCWSVGGRVVCKGLWNFALGLAPESYCWVPSTLETQMLRRAILLHLLGCRGGLSE